MQSMAGGMRQKADAWGGQQQGRLGGGLRIPSNFNSHSFGPNVPNMGQIMPMMGGGQQFDPRRPDINPFASVNSGPTPNFNPFRFAAHMQQPGMMGRPGMNQPMLGGPRMQVPPMMNWPQKPFNLNRPLSGGSMWNGRMIY